MVTTTLYNLATEFATEHRGIFVTIFVLPVSLLFDVFFSVRAWMVLKFYSAPKLHQKRVAGIQKQLETWTKNGKKGKLCTSRGGWQSISPSMRTYKSTSFTIDINLYDILELNKEEGWVHVEPMVNMGMISHYLVKHNLTIPVLPEMDDLTVGGLFMGVGIETSSHKYGLFNDTVIEAEVIMADGEVVTCSRTQNRELFDALPWSYGTIGFLASVKIKVIPCKPFVRIEYIPCQTQEEGVALLTELSCKENPTSFVEALSYSKEQMVVMPSEFVDASEVEAGKLNKIGRWYKPWFFRHVESFLIKNEKAVEYLPLRDYYHRHTKSIFWELEEIIPWGNNPIFRFLMGWAVPPKVGFLKLTQTKAIQKLYETQHVIQDMLVPISKSKEALDVFHDKYNIYPLWLCPYRAYSYADNDAPHRCFLREPQTQPGKDYEMYIDLGAYGVPKCVKDKKPFDIVTVSREVEAYVASVRGFQMLYADSYQTREEFREMFDHSHYDKLKAKYDPTNAFPEVFDKVCKKSKLIAGTETSETKKDK